jgi:hypothetical protein
VKEDSRKGASVSVGALLGKPGGGASFAGDLEGYGEESSGRASLSLGSLEGGLSTGVL